MWQMRMSSRSFASPSGSGAGRRALAGWDTRLNLSDSPLEPAIDQLRLIGEDRVTDEVFEGHCTVNGNRQLKSGQRRAAEVEKLIPPADLLFGNAEHLRPHGRQPVLGRRARPLVVLLGDTQFRGQRDQRL